MQADRTITIDLGDITRESRKLAAAITPKSGPWDVIVSKRSGPPITVRVAVTFNAL